MTADQLTCREAFEKWAIAQEFSIARDMTLGMYLVFDTEARWAVWQAAWNTSPTEGEAVAYLVPVGHAMPDGSMEYGEPYFVFADVASDYEKRIGSPCYTHPRATSDEVERLKALVGKWRDDADCVNDGGSNAVGRAIEDCADELDAALQQVTPSEVEMDAARYRWLRKVDSEMPRELDVVDHTGYVYEGRELDEAIDAAMAARGGE